MVEKNGAAGPLVVCGENHRFFATSDGSGTGHQVHTLDLPEITALQEVYVAKVIDRVGDLDHVLWEISNESLRNSVAWHYHLIDFIHRYEKGRTRQHPVGMTASPIENPELFANPADWISPRGKKYLEDPPVGETDSVEVDMTAAPGNFSVEWFAAESGVFIAGDSVEGGEKRSFTAPCSNHASLHLCLL